jgi:uncharacterized membrane protein YhaH (DUF805 family)
MGFQMNFTQSISSAFRNTFQFKGRASRSEYWWFMLATLLGTALIFGLWAVLSDIEALFPLLPLTFLVPIVLMVASISLSIRRLHDLNLSGWWFLVYSFVPKLAATATKEAGQVGIPMVGQQVIYLISIVTMIAVYGGFAYYFLQRGTIGPNEYGPDPLDVLIKPDNRTGVEFSSLKAY